MFPSFPPSTETTTVLPKQLFFRRQEAVKDLMRLHKIIDNIDSLESVLRNSDDPKAVLKTLGIE